MTLAYIKINGYSYRYYEPNNYIDYKLLVKQIKRVKEKLGQKRRDVTKILTVIQITQYYYNI